MSMIALALMVTRALGRHPRNGLTLDLGRYRVPRVAVVPVFHHVSFLAASGELFILLCRLHGPLYNEADTTPPADTRPRGPVASRECGHALRRERRRRYCSPVVAARPLPSDSSGQCVWR